MIPSLLKTCQLFSGAVECVLDLPVYLNTVTVEEEAVCFKLEKSAFIKLVKDKSIKTTAAVYKLAIIQSEARISRFKDDSKQFNGLLELLKQEYRKICKDDPSMMQ